MTVQCAACHSVATQVLTTAWALMGLSPGVAAEGRHVGINNFPHSSHLDKIGWSPQFLPWGNSNPFQYFLGI